MLRRSLLAHAPEFSSNTQSGQRYPKSGYGWTYLFNGRKRRFWLRSVLIETSERSRAINYRQRHAAILDSINTDKNAEKNMAVDVDDLRTDDHRRVWFSCGTCGNDYARTMKGRIHYGKGCTKFCDHELNNPAMHPTAEVPSLATLKAGGVPTATNGCRERKASTVAAPAAATVLDRLELFSERGSKDKMAQTPAWSEGTFKIKCADCDKVYESLLRAVTGTNYAGNVTTTPEMVELQNRCPDCKHKLLMKRAREGMTNDSNGTPAFYGGLSFS